MEGRFSLPIRYWMLSITIFMTAIRVPTSKASCVSALTAFISLPIFLSIRVSPFLFLIITLYTNTSILSIVFMIFSPENILALVFSLWYSVYIERGEKLWHIQKRKRMQAENIMRRIISGYICIFHLKKRRNGKRKPTRKR